MYSYYLETVGDLQNGTEETVFHKFQVIYLIPLHLFGGCSFELWNGCCWWGGGGGGAWLGAGTRGAGARAGLATTSPAVVTASVSGGRLAEGGSLTQTSSSWLVVLEAGSCFSDSVSLSSSSMPAKATLTNHRLASCHVTLFPPILAHLPGAGRPAPPLESPAPVLRPRPALGAGGPRSVLHLEATVLLLPER